MGAVLAADFALDGGFRRQGFERVRPDADARVRIDVADVPNGDIRFFRFINAGNQEVAFFVARDLHGELQVAFDACEPCFKLKRGNRLEGEWIVCNKCDRSFKLTEINAGGGGCKPGPIAHRLDGDVLLLAEDDILRGWRYFR